MLKALLIRRDYLHHMKETYSNFKDHLKDFGTLDYYDTLATPKDDKDGLHMTKDDDYESDEKEEDAWLHHQLCYLFA